MKGFSFRRMLLFSRLQIGEIYLKDIAKTLRVVTIIVISIPLLAMLFTGGDFTESVDLCENILLAFISVQILAFRTDLTSRRMLIPASMMEKYVSIYFSSIVIGIFFLVFSFIVGSAVFTAASYIKSPEDGGLTLLYFREGNSAAMLTYPLLIAIMALWITSFHAARKKFGKAVFWAGILGFAALVFVPILLEDSGAISEKAATLLSIASLSILVVVSIVWGYRLLAAYEQDSKDKTI